MKQDISSNDNPESELNASSDLESVEEDLTKYKDIAFKVNDNQPGLLCANSDDSEKWIPVRRRRRKKKRSIATHTSSDDELDILKARDVQYEEKDNTPGLYVRRGCTRSSVSWTPIKSSPVSSRTRLKTIQRSNK